MVDNVVCIVGKIVNFKDLIDRRVCNLFYKFFIITSQISLLEKNIKKKNSINVVREKWNKSRLNKIKSNPMFEIIMF